MGSEVHIPAGTYMVHRSLQIKGSNTTTPYYHAAVSGDGKASTIIRAAKNGEWTQATNSSNLAVVFFPSCCGALPKSGGGFYLRDLNIQANSAADYGVLAPAVQASLFQRLYVTGALVGGLQCDPETLSLPRPPGRPTPPTLPEALHDGHGACVAA